MESSLFNPGFIGSSFHWFIGQVADDSTWRENLNPDKFKKTEDIPGWGYRYKVRIIGHHDQNESDIKAEQLPWAQVMYPVTSGTGHGGSYQSPAIKQGMFVFGFFLDGKDQQTPIIMGCLANNAKTKLERKTGTEGSGGENFTPQSFYSKNQDEEPNEQRKLKDADLAPKQAGNEAYSSPSKENVAKESTDSNNQYTTADERKYGVLNKKHALACPNPDTQSDTKNIQTVISKVTSQIEAFQNSLRDADIAAGLPIVKNNKDIDKAIEDASQEMSKYMKGTMNKVQQFTTKEFNEKLAPLENLAPPSHALEILNKKVEGLEKIACMFNGMAGLALAALIAAALKNAFNRKKNKSEQASANAATAEAGVVGVSTEAVIPTSPALDTPGSNDVPPPTAEGFYRPTPLCETEEIIGEVLGGSINTIMQGFDSAIGPVIDEIQNSLGGTSTETGSSNEGTIDNAINENNVLSSLSSGDLVLSMSQTLADEAGIDPNSIGSSNRFWSDGNYGRGLVSFIDAAGQNTPNNQQLIADALSLIDDKSNSNGIAAGLVLASNILGVNENILSKNDQIVSAASCTTNCLAPVAKVLHDSSEVEKGFMTTIHAFTSDQRILDNSHKDPRRARSASQSIVPTSTGASKAIGEIIPSLKGKLEGVAMRVPTPNVSLIELVFCTKKEIDITKINDAFTQATKKQSKKILEITKEKLVSIDFNHNSASAIVDFSLTSVVGKNMGKISAWYDNEWGFSNRMCDITEHIHKIS